MPGLQPLAAIGAKDLAGHGAQCGDARGRMAMRVGEFAWHLAKYQPQQIAFGRRDRPVLLLDKAQGGQQRWQTAGQRHGAQHCVGRKAQALRDCGKCLLRLAGSPQCHGSVCGRGPESGVGGFRGAVVGSEAFYIARKLPLQQAATGYAQDLQRTALQRQVVALQHCGQPGRGLIGQLAHACAGQQAGFSVSATLGRCVYRIQVDWQCQQAGQFHPQGQQAVVAG